jgi:hypothetical protein
LLGLAHVLIGKPVPTFPGHALGAPCRSLFPWDASEPPGYLLIVVFL